jgi:hypothetical protein
LLLGQTLRLVGHLGRVDANLHAIKLASE